MRNAPDPRRREMLLEAAVRLIARDGLRKVRMQDLADEAGVAVGLPYRYFTGRTDLIAQVLTHVAERSHRGTMGTEPTGTGGDTARSNLVRELLVEINDHPTVRAGSRVWTEVSTAALSESELAEVVNTATRDWIAGVVDLAAEAGAADPHGTALRLVALVDGLSQWWLLGAIDTVTTHATIQAQVALELSGAVAEGTALPDDRD